MDDQNLVQFQLKAESKGIWTGFARQSELPRSILAYVYR